MKTICLTGATGFVASHILDRLLDSNQDYMIHATVRSTSDPTKYSHLTRIAEMKNKVDRVKFFEAHLNKDGSFDAAIANCDAVLHTASPYALDVEDAQRDLVDPAVNGTLNVLQSCLKHNVKRVVLTSSVAAITDSPDNDKIYTEEDWNTESSLTRNPYYYSKVAAEKAAWDFCKKNPSFELIVICPSVVIGPEFSDTSVNQSNKMFQQLTDGSFPAVVNLGWAFVDVRDVAQAHVLALESSKTFTPGDEKQGRFICCCETQSMQYVCDKLKELDLIEGKIPSFDMQCGVGNMVMKAASFMQPRGTGQYIRTNLGKMTHCNNDKIKRELGLTFTPLDKSIVDTVNDMINKKHLTPKKKK